MSLVARLWAQGPVLQIEVLEGEGATHAAGARVSGALRVRITDPFGKPVPGALVTFRLPDEGPTGTFSNGLNTEVLSAGQNGEAQTSSIRWNSSAGLLYIRVVAVKDQSRAGTAVPQFIADSAPAAGRTSAGIARPAPSRSSAPKLRAKWILIGLAIAAVGVGFAAGRAASSPKTAPAAEPVKIGPPSITIGRP